MNLTDLHTFVQVAECGSITGAAEKLGVPKSTVSRRVNKLEASLGVDLLARGSGRAGLTAAGTKLHSLSARALRELLDVEQSVRNSALAASGELRISAPLGLGSTVEFTDIIAGFRRRYPQIHLDIVLTGRMVDLHSETFDVALRAHTGPLADTSLLKMKPLGTMPLGLFASPRYIDEFGEPKKPSDLSAHIGITLGHFSNRWRFRRGEERVVVEFDAAIRYSDFASMMPLLVAGAGISALPSFLSARPVADGELTPVLPDWKLPPARLSVVWPAQQHMPAKLRHFIDFIFARAAQQTLFLGMEPAAH